MAESKNYKEFQYKKPKVYVSYWVEKSGYDQTVTVNVADTTHGSKLESMHTFWVRPDVSEVAILREALDYSTTVTGQFEGTIYYSGPGNATLHSLRNRPNVKLERVEFGPLNEAFPSMAKAVRNTLVG